MNSKHWVLFSWPLAKTKSRFYRGNKKDFSKNKTGELQASRVEENRPPSIMEVV